ncbi:hypothetical protein THOM_0518 [Trachipleistophora hominis]|uniref:Uncharacterized protein n=1 Tax=Trachipleistophora hominis TaxID=72359 RepID=L7JYU2_TRAHO|nr:hypothetical protein THOM_0518 [Trachipleistophora hominis]
MLNKEDNFYPTNRIEESLLSKTARDIRILKREIREALGSPAKLRYLVDFENGAVAYNPPKIFKKIVIQKKWSSKECARRSEEYYREISNLPIRFVLMGSDKVVFTEEWVYAIEERKNLKLLRKINFYRAKLFEDDDEEVCEGVVMNGGLKSTGYEKRVGDRLSGAERAVNGGQSKIDVPGKCALIADENINVDQHLHAKQMIARKLAHEAKAFIQKNTLYEDEEIRILDFQSTYTYQKQEIEEQPKKTKEYAKVFELMKSENSKTNFKIPNIKKKGTCHSSHAAALSKIPYDLSRMSMPTEILSYKTMRAGNNIRQQ